MLRAILRNHHHLSRNREVHSVLPCICHSASVTSSSSKIWDGDFHFQLFSNGSSRNISYFNRHSKGELKLIPHVLLKEQPYRNAGHSKWQNIRHVKQANDMARAREMAKYITLIKAVIRDTGSADPKQNSKLASVIAQVKDAKLPMAAVDRLLQNLQAKKELRNCIYPVKGPGNSIMLIDLESTNLAKSKQELNTVLRKNKAIAADESVMYLFDHKGLLFCSEVNGKPVNQELLDAATEHAIEAGASDVTFIEDHPEYGPVFEFVTEPSSFFKVKGSLEGLNYKLEFAEIAYIPRNWVELEDQDIEAANKLYAKLTEHPDVQKVFVNIA